MDCMRLGFQDQFKVDLWLWGASEVMESKPTDCVSNPESLRFSWRATLSRVYAQSWDYEALALLRRPCTQELLVKYLRLLH